MKKFYDLCRNYTEDDLMIQYFVAPKFFKLCTNMRCYKWSLWVGLSKYDNYFWQKKQLCIVVASYQPIEGNKKINKLAKEAAKMLFI